MWEEKKIRIEFSAFLLFSFSHERNNTYMRESPMSWLKLVLHVSWLVTRQTWHEINFTTSLHDENGHLEKINRYFHYVWRARLQTDCSLGLVSDQWRKDSHDSRKRDFHHVFTILVLFLDVINVVHTRDSREHLRNYVDEDEDPPHTKFFFLHCTSWLHFAISHSLDIKFFSNHVSGKSNQFLRGQHVDVIIHL